MNGSGVAERRFSVLLAEDNDTNQKLAIACLKKLGCRIETATTGHEVMALVHARRYDLVLMDCWMPEMDGYTATKEIRKQEESEQRVLIIAVTANALKGDREKCIEAGMDDYLAKPIRLGDCSGSLRNGATGLHKGLEAHAAYLNGVVNLRCYEAAGSL